MIAASNGNGDTSWLLLASCIVAFGFSMVVDGYPIAFGGQVFIEESFKILGIMFLTAYLVMTSQKALHALRPAGIHKAATSDAALVRRGAGAARTVS